MMTKECYSRVGWNIFEVWWWWWGTILPFLSYSFIPCHSYRKWWWLGGRGSVLAAHFPWLPVNLIKWRFIIMRIVKSLWLLHFVAVCAAKLYFKCDGKLNLLFFCLLTRAREALRQCLPDQLKDGTFSNCLKDDASTKRWLSQLMKNLQDPTLADPRGIPLPPWQYYFL